MGEINFGPCDCCRSGSSSGSSSSGSSGLCPCSDAATLYLDFEGEVIALAWTGGSWEGTGNPGSCVADWGFTVTCLNHVWQLVIDNPNSATCATPGTPMQGEILSCEPLEIEFSLTVDQPPMTTCCLGGTFPRTIPLLLSL